MGPRRLVLPRGGWIVGALEADYETVGASTLADALPGARVLALRLLRGRVVAARRSSPPVIRADAPRPITQQTLSCFIDFEGAEEQGRVHAHTLHDVFVLEYRAEALLDDLTRARGLLRGTIYARVSAKPWTWGRLLAWLALLLLVLVLLLALVRCPSTQPMLEDAKNTARHTLESARERWRERGALDEDAALVAQATKGATGRAAGGTGAGASGGAGGAASAGAGGSASGGAGPPSSWYFCFGDLPVAWQKSSW